MSGQDRHPPKALLLSDPLADAIREATRNPRLRLGLFDLLLPQLEVQAADDDADAQDNPALVNVVRREQERFVERMDVRRLYWREAKRRGEEKTSNGIPKDFQKNSIGRRVPPDSDSDSVSSSKDKSFSSSSARASACEAKKRNEKTSKSGRPSGFQEVADYFEANGWQGAGEFFTTNEAAGWTIDGQPVKDWKRLALGFISSKARKPRVYGGVCDLGG